MDIGKRSKVTVSFKMSLQLHISTHAAGEKNWKRPGTATIITQLRTLKIVDIRRATTGRQMMSVTYSDAFAGLA